MKVQRAGCIPLAVHDPYFSIWSASDRLYEKDTVHWSGLRQQMRGYLTVGNETLCFLGDSQFHQVIPQTSVDVTATATEYTFENDALCFRIRFVSPLLLDDMALVSRPCTYIEASVERKTSCPVAIDFLVSSDLVQRGGDELIGTVYHRPQKHGAPAYSYASMGRACQQPLCHSGDNITIDWGYVYLASEEEHAALSYDKENRNIRIHIDLGEDQDLAKWVLAYDDLLSINYFGQWRKAYWTEVYPTILDAIGAAMADRKEVLARAEKLDQEIYERALELGGEDYAYLCALSYRHSIAAHKLITDEEGNVIFLSKENDSNGCIGTVDVSYPSVPLYLLYNTEYVKGMLRPVFQFADCDVWEYDFAPHDVGRYPYAWGQVYGVDRKQFGKGFHDGAGNINPPYYQYPAGSEVYDFKYQMPVEECGNMLLMTAAVCRVDKTAAFAEPYMGILETWTRYLLTYGADPGEQLCTDDFAGHLSHNVNLSAKAIMGIEAYAQLAGQLETLMSEQGNPEKAEEYRKKAAEYHQKAKEMAADWERRANVGDHYSLTFDQPDSWSLKYNLIWDRFFGTHLFSEEVYQKEYKYYLEHTERYGTPLDSRKTYTKSDWILWCAAFAGSKEEAEQLIRPIAEYQRSTESRYPFSDWYDAITGKYCAFKGRSVQGGIFMPILMAETTVK